MALAAMTSPIQTVLSIQPIQVETFVDGSAIDQVLDQGLNQGKSVAIAQYQSWLTIWLNALAPQLSPIHAYEVSLRLTDDAEIQQLNTDYRHQNQPTDVLSFAALETEIPGAAALHEQQPLYLGDIIISVETAARQALETGHSLPQEVAWLAAHGLLHLLGWDHPDDDSLTRMLDKQTQLLNLIDLTV
jgi:probable rRNA maturation factor